MKYRIAFKHVCGEEGHGDWFDAKVKPFLEAAIEEMNHTEIEFTHWLESSEDEKV